MKKAKIAIASVLKPVTEPRAYTKLAISLRETRKYHLNIIGFCSKKSVNESGIQFTTIFCRRRTHLLRFLAQFRFLKAIFSYKPDLLIVTTYELLPMALLGKFLLDFRLVYDLQENYSQNVLLNHTAPRFLRKILAIFIRVIEKNAHPFVDHYFFAEQIYALQFPHISNYTLLENKYAGPSLPPTAATEYRPTFIMSGTITPVYGVEIGLQWFLSLQQTLPNTSLHIIGHTPLLSFRKRIETLAADKPNIRLDLSENPLPYSAILKAVQAAEIVLMPYETRESIRLKIPSKLYESIALQKPVLITRNPLWEKIIAQYPAGIGVDFSMNTKAALVYTNLLSHSLYQKLPLHEVTWKGERSNLLKIIQKLLS